MITRIREVRRARGLTLEDVAQRCEPPTTPQTVGRLETGTRTVSLRWLNRLAKALGVEAQDLVEGGGSAELEVAAVLSARGASPPKHSTIVVAPQIDEGQIAVLVVGSVGDYRTGDEIWCYKLQPKDYGLAMNLDVLVPRTGRRFLFGRLINRDQEKLQILPLEAGARQQVVANPPWLGVAKRLVRTL